MSILKEGIDLMSSRRYQEALSKFDIAINIQKITEAYRERAYCLQAMGFHLDAIDDFTLAIKFFPTHANNYYGRSVSYGSLGYYQEALKDTNHAITLSKIESVENQALNKIAEKMGYSNTTDIYKVYLSELLNEMNETDEIIRRLNIKQPIRRPS